MSGTARRDTRWWTLAAVSAATFMTTLDNNIVNVALPTIQRQLGLSLAGLEWVVSGYILVFAGLLLVGGRLADVYGHRRVFLAGLAVFTTASLVAGLAGDAALLVAGRAVQGVGAALLTPTALAILPVAFPEQRQRNLAVGVWSAVTAISLALGPFVGGFISQRWHWGWIFWINVPVGVVTLALGAATITQSRAAGVGRRLDLPGLVASTLVLGGLTFALIEGPSRGWMSPSVLAAFAAAMVAAGAFVLVEHRATDPMVDLSLFRERVFAGGALVLGLWAFGVFGVYFFTALYLQDVLGFSPTAAGAAFVPMALVMAAVAAVSGPIAQRLGTRRIVAVGLALMAAAILGTASIGRGGLGELLPWFLVYGVGAGLLVPLTGAIIERLPAEHTGVGSGVLNVSREVFGLLGITILGAILTTHRASDLHRGADAAAAFLSGYQLALVVAAVIVAAGVPLSLYALRAGRTAPALAVPGAAEPVGAGSR